MSDAAIMVGSREIVVDEVFPYTLNVVWKTLATPRMMGRWLHMEPAGFVPVVGTRFTFKTTPAGAWDGTIRRHFAEPDRRLTTRSYLTGETFTVSDAYVFTVVSSSTVTDIDLAAYSHHSAYQARVAARPKVREALVAEGLAPEAVAA